MWVLIAVFVFSGKQIMLLPTTHHKTAEKCETAAKQLKKDLALREGDGVFSPSNGKVATSCILDNKDG